MRRLDSLDAIVFRSSSSQAIRGDRPLTSCFSHGMMANCESKIGGLILPSWSMSGESCMNLTGPEGWSSLSGGSNRLIVLPGSLSLTALLLDFGNLVRFVIDKGSKTHLARLWLSPNGSDLKT